MLLPNCDSNSCHSSSPLKAIAKSKRKLFAIAFKGENYCYLDGKQEMKQRRLKTITKLGAIGKIPKLQLQC